MLFETSYSLVLVRSNPVDQNLIPLGPRYPRSLFNFPNQQKCPPLNFSCTFQCPFGVLLSNSTFAPALAPTHTNPMPRMRKGGCWVCSKRKVADSRLYRWWWLANCLFHRSSVTVQLLIPARTVKDVECSASTSSPVAGQVGILYSRCR